MSVPVRNVFYLLCYAWNHLEARSLFANGTDAGERIENLIAHVLSRGLSRLLAQGLDQGYVAQVAEIAGVRGKLLVGATIKRLQMHSGRTTCEVDEFTPDVPHNRILKATMLELASLASVDLKLRGALRQQLLRFSAVGDITLNSAAFRPVQLTRNLARYGFLIQLCELVCRSLLPDPATGGKRFHPFDADERQMGAVFEAFVYNFLAREQSDFQVGRRNVDWSATAERTNDLAFLPQMRTDVILTSAKRRVIIETKFYAQPLRAGWHGGSPKLISGHLYQLLAYLTRFANEPGPDPEGMLLYASAGESFDLVYDIGGRRVRVVTLDLDAPWPQIEESLHELVR